MPFFEPYGGGGGRNKRLKISVTAKFFCPTPKTRKDIQTRNGVIFFSGHGTCQINVPPPQTQTSLTRPSFFFGKLNFGVNFFLPVLVF